MTDFSVDATLVAQEPDRRLNINIGMTIVASAALGGGAAALASAYGWRQGALYLVGGALGVTLYHALFGFASAWRVFIADRRGAGLRAQMIMLALAIILFYPALGHDSLFGRPVHGFYGPVGIGMLTGAFFFGVGMQLGGSCASGTLYTVGGGNTRMLVTLAGFIVGSTVGALHLPWWNELPNIGSVPFIARLGWPSALTLSLIAMAAIYGFTVVMERRAHGGQLVAGRLTTHSGWRRLVQGPWPLVAGAVGLALGNFATLWLAGRPWGITSAMALWGAKIVAAFGGHPEAWTYWQVPAAAASLHHSIFRDITSIMDLGIIAGAMLAASLAGKFQPEWRAAPRSMAAAAIGGFLLGYGARLAYGCNIGAYFSGVASGSLHGWLWLILAFAGSIVGTRLRPLFGLSVERSGAARRG